MSTGICTGELAFSVSPRRVIGGEIFVDSRTRKILSVPAMVETMAFLHAIKPKLFHSGQYVGQTANLRTHE